MIPLQRKKVSIHFVSFTTEFETTIRNFYLPGAFTDCHSKFLKKGNAFSKPRGCQHLLQNVHKLRSFKRLEISYKSIVVLTPGTNFHNTRILMGYKFNSQLDDYWVWAVCIRTVLVLNFVVRID